MTTEYAKLISQVRSLQNRFELSQTVGPDYFEPGMMECLDQYRGEVSSDGTEIIMCFEVRGTRYEGRTERIETVHVGDEVRVLRDETNPFNSNNFSLVHADGRGLGNMPAELCNVIAPLYDAGLAEITDCKVSYVEPISKRSRYARQAILFVQLNLRCNVEH